MYLPPSSKFGKKKKRILPLRFCLFLCWCNFEARHQLQHSSKKTWPNLLVAIGRSTYDTYDTEVDIDLRIGSHANMILFDLGMHLDNSVVFVSLNNLGRDLNFNNDTFRSLYVPKWWYVNVQTRSMIVNNMVIHKAKHVMSNQHKAGHISNMGGVGSGGSNTPLTAVYRSTKFGLRQLQPSLFKECRTSKVGVRSRLKLEFDHTTSPGDIKSSKEFNKMNLSTTFEDTANSFHNYDVSISNLDYCGTWSTRIVMVIVVVVGQIIMVTILISIDFTMTNYERSMREARDTLKNIADRRN
ncbi:putative chlorophyll(ide) b reductase [Helianthus anomalus]